MDKQDYLRMLEDGHAETDGFGGREATSRLEFLADHIFDFTTYDSAIAELFAGKAVEVCAAISARKTFDYIEDADNYRWFLLMCNMPFFAPRLNWGTSIRGAWWDYGPITFETSGLFWQGKQITEKMSFTGVEWALFIEAVCEFSAGGKQPNVC